jgi:hypothetical protein
MERRMDSGSGPEWGKRRRNRREREGYATRPPDASASPIEASSMTANKVLNPNFDALNKSQITNGEKETRRERDGFLIRSGMGEKKRGLQENRTAWAGRGNG